MAVQRATQINFLHQPETVQYKVESGSTYEFNALRYTDIRIYKDNYQISNPYTNPYTGHNSMDNDMVCNGYILRANSILSNSDPQTRTRHIAFSDGLTFQVPMGMFKREGTFYQTNLSLPLRLHPDFPNNRNIYQLGDLPCWYIIDDSYFNVSSVKAFIDLENNVSDLEELEYFASEYEQDYPATAEFLRQIEYGAVYVHPRVIYASDSPYFSEEEQNLYRSAREYWAISDLVFMLPFATENEFHLSSSSNFVSREVIHRDQRDAWQTISNYTP